MADSPTTQPYFAQIADGLETEGVAELTALGAIDARPTRRGIHFRADRAALYRINYLSRLCTRILAPVKNFTCGGPDDIYRAGRGIDWSRYLTPEQTFAVFANSAGSRVPHSQFAALKLKDAVADQFRDGYGRRPNVDPLNPDLWINLYIHEDRGTIGIDTSGGSLHRRGYRSASVDAPMQETVGAAVVGLAGWSGERPLVDFMCGSGTLVIEAAMAYCRIPAGFLRTAFGFQRMPDFDAALWASVKAQADGQMRKLPAGLISASDVDAAAIKAIRANCRMLPHVRRIDVLRLDYRKIAGLEKRTLVCNPPYGIRLRGGPALETFYRELGDFLKQRCTGSDAYIYFGNRDMLKCIGLKPSWKKPLRNGGLDGRLVKYALY